MHAHFMEHSLFWARNLALPWLENPVHFLTWKKEERWETRGRWPYSSACSRNLDTIILTYPALIKLTAGGTQTHDPPQLPKWGFALITNWPWGRSVTLEVNFELQIWISNLNYIGFLCFSGLLRFKRNGNLVVRQKTNVMHQFIHINRQISECHALLC